jgi:hypothetical protein
VKLAIGRQGKKMIDFVVSFISLGFGLSLMIFFVGQGCRFVCDMLLHYR